MTARAHRTGGFTLIEMMVTIAIIAIITTVVLFNHQEFSDVVELGNETQDVALAIRQMQIEGLAVSNFSMAGPNVFDPGRGVYVDLASPGEYVLFGDDNDNKKYDTGDDEEIETRELRRGFEIIDICGVKKNDDVLCIEENVPSDGELTDASESIVHISFKRPRPNADIIIPTPGGGGPIHMDETGPGSDYKAVRVYIRSPQDRTSYVEVTVSGEIGTDAMF